MPAESEASGNFNDQFGETEGVDVPFSPHNACCNAPCPPGAFCNTDSCDRKTTYYKQKWNCIWKKTPLDCGSTHIDCAWTKAWTCQFKRVQRCDVLKAMSTRKPARCPDASLCYEGENECFVPEDIFFAKVWEIEYEHTQEPTAESADTCYPVDFEGNPAGCAACGLYEICQPRWVRIYSKAQIPPEFPYAVPLPFYERPQSAPKKQLCGGAPCKLGSRASASPDFWKTPASLY